MLNYSNILCGVTFQLDAGHFEELFFHMVFQPFNLNLHVVLKFKKVRQMSTSHSPAISNALAISTLYL